MLNKYDNIIKNNYKTLVQSPIFSINNYNNFAINKTNNI